MKGKILTKTKIANLKDGTRVWIEDLDDECEPDIYILEDNYFKDKNDYYYWKYANTIAVYEWIEDSKSEQTITKEIKEHSRQKTYKGSEILTMLENLEIDDDTIIIDNNNEEYTAIQIFRCFTTWSLVNQSPFKIKQKPVDYITAVNSGKNIRPMSLSTEKNFHPYTYWLGFMVSGLAHKEKPLDLINGLWEIEC